MSKRIRIVPYDPSWPDLFEGERRDLEAVFAGVPVRVEHVGSTAVPGLASKPVLDIMIGVVELAHVEARLPSLEALGYQYVPEYEARLPERRYFRKPVTRPRTHHLHAVVEGGELWLRHLRLRDILRARPDLAREYEELKRELAERFTHDGAAYTEAKSPFIERVMEQEGELS